MKTIKIKDIKEFDENSSYYAELTNKIDKLQSEFDEKQAVAKKAFEDSIKLDVLGRNTLEDSLLKYVDDNQEEMFASKKTYKNKFVSVSIRSTTTFDFKHGFNVTKVAEIIRTKYKFLAERFIVIKETLNKTAINASIKSQELNDTILDDLGLETNEKETIILKINK